MRKVAVIGAGKVGSTLTIALKQAGVPIAGVLSASRRSAELLAAKAGAFVFCSLTDLAAEADIIIISVPDGKIAGIAEGLAQTGRISGGKTVLHTCGSQSAEALCCLAQLGGNIGSIHPLQAFSSVDLTVGKMKGTYFVVDGDERAVEAAKWLVGAIGGNFLAIDSACRPLYHAAACMASNYMVAVVYGAVQMMQKIGIAEKDALAALKPLLQGTVDNLTENGTVKALTGPIARGDDGTLRKHLLQIAALSPKEEALYRDVGVYTVEIAQAQGGITSEKAKALESVLRE